MPVITLVARASAKKLTIDAALMDSSPHSEPCWWTVSPRHRTNAATNPSQPKSRNGDRATRCAIAAPCCRLGSVDEEAHPCQEPDGPVAELAKGLVRPAFAVRHFVGAGTVESPGAMERAASQPQAAGVGAGAARQSPLGVRPVLRDQTVVKPVLRRACACGGRCNDCGGG